MHRKCLNSNKVLKSLDSVQTETGIGEWRGRNTSLLELEEVGGGHSLRLWRIAGSSPAGWEKGFLGAKRRPKSIPIFVESASAY